MTAYICSLQRMPYTVNYSCKYINNKKNYNSVIVSVQLVLNLYRNDSCILGKR